MVCCHSNRLQLKRCRFYCSLLQTDSFRRHPLDSFCFSSVLSSVSNYSRSHFFTGGLSASERSSLYPHTHKLQIIIHTSTLEIPNRTINDNNTNNLLPDLASLCCAYHTRSFSLPRQPNYGFFFLRGFKNLPN